MSKNPKKKKAGKKAKRDIPKAENRIFDSIQALEARSPLQRHELVDLAIVFGVSIILRIIFFFLNKHNNPLFYHPIMDSLYHHEWAEQIISGNFWGDTVFFRAPLYPYLLALLYKISGSSIGFAVFCQHILGAVTSACIYFLSREFFSRNVAILAGLFAALYWPFIYFEGELLIINLILFLDVVLLWCLAVAMRRWDKKWFFVSGLLLGLSALARPNVLILIPILPIVLRYGGTRNNGNQTIFPWKKETALILSGAALLIFPLIVRNYVIGRDIVPIASQGGVNFYIGNNPLADGRTAIMPGTRPDWWGGYYDAIHRAEKATGRSLKPSEVSNYYFKEGFKFIFSSPQAAAKLFLRKFRLFWAGGERSNNKFIYFFWDLSGMGKIPLPGFWLIAPIALLGGVLQWRRRRTLALLYLFVLSYMIGIIAFFVNARFRLPIVPVLIVFAAYAVFHFIAAYRLRSFGALKIILILVLCIIVVNYDFLSFQENKTHEDSISHYSLGNAYMKIGKRDLAISEYEKARSTNHRYPKPSYSLIERNVNYNLGLLYWEDGLCTQAIEVLESVGGTDEYAFYAMEYLAECYLKEGRFNEAIRMYKRIVSVKPGNQKAVVGLARVYRKSGNLERSEAILRSQLERSGINVGEIHFELAVTLEQKGDIDDAIDNYVASAKNPSFQKDSYLALARLYRQSGQEQKALEYMSKARAGQANNPPSQ